MDHVLLVEDDSTVAESVVLALRVNGYAATHAPTLKAARQALAAKAFVAVLLDVNLPDGSGFTLCGEIIEGHPGLPVLLLTARTDEESAVKGLTAGAFDYVRKPFGSAELLVRLKRAIGRDAVDAKIFSWGELKVNSTDRRAFYGGRAIGLTPTEFDILLLLVRRGGALVDREQLLGTIDAEGEIFDKSLASHVSRLRTKLKTASSGTVQITGVYGQGYRLERS